MNTHADKTQENKSQSVANVVSKMRSGEESVFQLVDNRPEAASLRKLQEMANNSPRVKQAAQLQVMADNYSSQQQNSIQKIENNTCLPDNLKSGIENLSGYSMDDVKLHYNSYKPAQLNAHAYAQGTDIHLASGQEKYLPHELWHVVQQKQGRVKANVQLIGKTNINDDAALENEADEMGAKAETLDTEAPIQTKTADSGFLSSSSSQPMQYKIKDLSTGASPTSNSPIQKVGETDEEETTDPFTSLFGPVVKGYNIQSGIDQRIGLRTLELGEHSSLHSMMSSPIVSPYDSQAESSQAESSSALKITSETLEGLSTNQKALTFLNKYPERYRDVISEQFQTILNADEDRVHLTNASHLLDAVLENFDSDQWGNLGKVLEKYVDARPKHHDVPPPGLGKEFSGGDFNNFFKKNKYFNNKGNTILGVLLAKNAIRITKTHKNIHSYICLPKLETLLDSPIQAKSIFQAIGEKGTVDEYAEELGKLKEFFTGQIYIHPDVREKFEELKDKHSASFKDWFHSFSSTLNLLSGRSDVPNSIIRKILKYELNKYHLQATYNIEDTLRLGRQTSPLVMEGYARGIKTGMWDLSRKINEDKLKEQYLESKKSLQKKGGDLDEKFDERFNVFPAPKPFEYHGVSPEIFSTVPANINSKHMVYISSLKVQLIKALTKESKQKEGGSVSSHMGGRGLRASASESAETVIDEMIKLINAKNLDAALALVTKLSYDKTDPKKDVINKLKTVTLNVNTLIAPSKTDPITETTDKDVERLTAAYEQFCTYTNKELLPFYVHQNVRSVKNLLGSNGSFLFSKKIPATVSGDLISSIEKAMEIMNVIPFTKDSSKIESFYQQIQNIHHFVRFALDWKYDDTDMRAALTGMLPSSAIAPQMTQTAPHGLAMIDHVAQSLPQEDRNSAALLHGAYYETPHLFEGAETKARVDDPSLKTKKLIVMEPHPNNAASPEIQPHNPVELIQNLFKQAEGPYTVIMDVTLNHLQDKEIEDTLNEAKQYIESGKLNLVLLQSGTKFFQNGMDLVNIGTAIIFNNNKEDWVNFNEEMSKTPVQIPKDDELYIANMLVKNKETLKEYLDKIRSNTKALRGKITSKLREGYSAFEMVPNTDTTTVYISFQPNDSYVRYKLDLPQNSQVTVDQRAKVNQDVYFNHLLPSFKHLPSVDRSSFGFNISNFGECYNTVRITPGIENEELLDSYTDTIITLGEALSTQKKRKQNPSRYRKWLDKRSWQKLLQLGMITPEEAEKIKEEVAAHKAKKKNYYIAGRPGHERPDPAG